MPQMGERRLGYRVPVWKFGRKAVEGRPEWFRLDFACGIHPLRCFRKSLQVPEDIVVRGLFALSIRAEVWKLL